MSRMASVSHPGAVPDLFLDRSLGRQVVPDILRGNGLRHTTSAERYGAHHDQFVEAFTMRRFVPSVCEMAH